MNSIIAAKKQGLWKLLAELTKQNIRLAIKNLTVESSGNGKRLHMKRKMYVPNDKNLQLFLLQHYHTPPTHDHPGFKIILQKVQENWFWFGIASHCKRYATNCATCRHTKAYNTQKQGFLNLLPIPNKKWMNLSLDFVVQLPEYHCRN